MTKPDTYFLSASVPDPCAPHFVAPSDAIAVSAAVKALLYVILGRRKLVWGGHPAITPMVWSVASSMGVDYSAWVALYQTNHFKDRFPADNERFNNVTFTPEVTGEDTEDVSQTRAMSLLHMRQRMFDDHEFSTAIFIGGMMGVVEEFDMLRETNQEVNCVPIISTGGVTKLLAERTRLSGELVARLERDVDYIPMFYDICGISPSEPRLRRPSDETDLDMSGPF